MTFAELIAPISVNTFYSDYWEKKPFMLSAKDSKRYERVFSLQDFDGYIRNGHASAHFFRVSQSGKTFHPRQWSDLQTRRDHDATHLVNAEKIFTLFDEGASIILGSAEHSFDALRSFCNSIGQELFSRVQANIYITPPNSQALDAHFDTHDVLVMQISGKKTWRLYDCPIEKPILEQQYDVNKYIRPDQASIEFTLSQGDIAYIPRGWVHDAKAHSQSSVHITLGLHNVQAINAFDVLRKRAADMGFFRSGVPNRNLDDTDSESYKTLLKKQLYDLIEKESFDALFTALKSQKESTRETHYANRYQDLILKSQLSLHSIVRPCELNLVWEKNEKQACIRNGIRELVIPDYLFNSIRSQLSRGAPFRVKQTLGLLSDAGKLHLVGELIKIGALTIDNELYDAVKLIESNRGLVPDYVNARSGAVCWHDLGQYHVYQGNYNRAIEEFYTLNKHIAGSDEAATLNTSFKALDLLEIDSLEPTLLIFHMSRCGSTLVSKSLAHSRNNLVYGEANVFNSLLEYELKGSENNIPTKLNTKLRLKYQSLFKAMGRKRLNSHENYIVKFPSLYCRFITDFAEMFPNAKLLFLYRDPIEVMASLDQGPFNMIKERHTQRNYSAVADDPPSSNSANAYAAKLLERSIISVLNSDSKNLSFMNYENLNRQNVPTLLEEMNLRMTSNEIEKIQHQFSFYSKEGRKLKKYSDDSAIKQALASDEIKRLCQEFLTPLYEKLRASTKNIDFHV